jgi:mRNA-degrading endonuclease RelE of RelBE toxin-antitoxin system
MQAYMRVRNSICEGVEEDLKKIRAYHRNQIVDAIEEQLADTPETLTKNRKLLEI